jgi:hypothetical protein
MEVNFDSINTYVDFEIIEIRENKDPYLAFVGIDWDLYNDDVLNLKK